MIVHLCEKRSRKDVFLRVRDAVLVVESRWLKAERVEPVTFASRAEALADAERRLHKWLVRGRFEVVTRHDDDAWLQRLYRAERVARRIEGETNAGSGIVADGAVYWGIPTTEETLAWVEENMGFALPAAMRDLLCSGTCGASASVTRDGNRMGTSIQVGASVMYSVEDGWVRGLAGFSTLPPLRAQLAYRGTALGIGRLPVIGGEDQAQGPLLLPDGSVLLVEHGAQVGQLPSVEAFADHALAVFEEGCDRALEWVRR
ncbi:MAG: hypothetical protein IPI43_08710 [Sandaracinaceae bacterium]|nr:hypothetical protein [Sandaracinaceae bacterium]